MQASGGALALVRSTLGTASRFSNAESTTPLPFSTLTLNTGAPPASAYVFTAYNYDPCAYEAVHGTLTLPRGGMKVEILVSASAGDGGGAWLLAGSRSVGLGDAKQARLVVADANTGTLSSVLATDGNFALLGASAGGSGKQFATGSGTADVTFAPADAASSLNATAYNFVGTFTPQLCRTSGSTATPTPSVDAASPVDKGALRFGGLFNLGSNALSVPAPDNVLASSAQANAVADVQSQVLASNITQASIVRNEHLSDLGFATLTKNVSQDVNQSFVLSVYNYDPCAYEAVHGDYAMPPGGIKMETFVNGRSGDGAWLSSAATILDGMSLAQTRLVKAASTGCSLAETSVVSGSVVLTGWSTGGSGKILPTGTGKLQATFNGQPAVNQTSYTNTVFGRFTPTACSKKTAAAAPSAADGAPCTDAGHLRQTSLTLP